MSSDWQNLIVSLIVAGAAGYVGRLAWRSLLARKTSACGGCRGCASPEEVRGVFNIAAPTSDTNQAR